MSLTLGAFGPPDPSTDNLAWPVPWRGMTLRGRCECGGSMGSAYARARAPASPRSGPHRSVGTAGVPRRERLGR
jgi:hypothetical protein